MFTKKLELKMLRIDRVILINNNPETRGGPGRRDRMQALKRRKTQLQFFLHISSSYAKILGETNIQPLEIPKVGQKQMKEKERKKD